MNIKLISFVLLMFVVAACQEDSNEYQSNWSVNPNGDSELALLMRDMFDEGMALKQQIKEGKKPKLISSFETIHSAKATEPEKAASPEYKVYADAYLASLNALKSASLDDAPQAYNGMVQSCMACHSALCPGPKVKIKKLFIKQ